MFRRNKLRVERSVENVECLNHNKLVDFLLTLLALLLLLLLQIPLELILLTVIVELLHLVLDDRLLFFGQDSEGKGKARLDVLSRDLLLEHTDHAETIVI